MISGLLDSLRPTPQCLFCALPAPGTGIDICHYCLARLPFNFHACRYCAAPLAVAGDICGRCLVSPPLFTRTLAPFHYAPPIDRLISRLKYRGKLQGARILGALLAEFVRGRSELPELIIPMPLHPRRLRKRGFNQATELARVTGRALGVPLERHCCRRTRATGQQTQLARRERQANVRGAFSMQRSLPVKHVAIVDDVMTTGSTAAELARVLLASGTERVDLWVAARAELSE